VRSKLATGVALVAAVGIFLAVFLVTRSLLWSPLLAAAGAVGLYLMVDSRRPSQVSDDEYAADAENKMDDALRTVREIRRSLRDVSSPTARHLLQQACDQVPELLARVKARSPNSLYSSASQLGVHLTSLSGVLTQYLDIQKNPSFYTNPAALLSGGEAAFDRFAQFTLDSLRLVNSGDIAQYQANLETVAPPKLPTLS
jgi:5-bromo-4-chloroindolyl phosphate hydrolysis protein